MASQSTICFLLLSSLGLGAVAGSVYRASSSCLAIYSFLLHPWAAPLSGKLPTSSPGAVPFWQLQAGLVARKGSPTPLSLCFVAAVLQVTEWQPLDLFLVWHLQS